MIKKQNLIKQIIIRWIMMILVGGIVYVSFEHFSRGFSHWTMFLVGGLCFSIIGVIRRYTKLNYAGIIPQMICCGSIITIIEFISGCILNLWLKMNIWDYSDKSFNLLGQICLQFYGLWIIVSIVGIVLDDFLREKFFNESTPTYHLI